MTNEYIAGLIDGEGYFGLLPNKASALKVTSFSPVFKIAMTGSTAVIIMNQLQQRYGGRVERKSKLSTGKREVTMYVAKSRKTVKTIISDVLPHLIVKREQAQLLKEFCEMPTSHSLYGSFDPKVVQRKAYMYEELKRLKQPESLATTE